MFFNASKLFWFAFQPLTVIFVLVLAAFVALWRGHRGWAAAALGLCCALIFAGAFTTLGAVLLAPLENRFRKPADMPPRVAGIVVLGGYMDGQVNAVREGTELNGSADRIVETMRLARLYPEAKIVISGGEGGFFEKAAPDAETTRRLLAGFGLSGERFLYENGSRNTVENAVFSKELAQPKPGETWLLVTSAFHMPRSVGCFRKAGFDVTAWPVDYRTRPGERLGLYLESANEALSLFSVAMREWIGLAAYRLTDRTDMLVPQP